MKFGIDFGTTTTSIALADRGNYPVVSFIDDQGDAVDSIPSMIAFDENRMVFGFDAAKLAREGAPAMRSLKRLLSDPNVTASSTFRLAGRSIVIVEALTRFLEYVADLVRHQSSIAQIDDNEPLEVAVGVPAHAWSAQRFLTLEAFRNAGWNVLAMINEPSAAGFEYTHRHRGTINSKRTSVLVYDLGGGTFDASVVSARGKDHEILGSRGDNLLGGDDFDAVLATCFARAADTDEALLGEDAWRDLLEQSRVAKESLTPNTRALTAQVDNSFHTIPVADFYEAARPLVERTVEVFSPLIQRSDDGLPALNEDIAGVYVVGGASSLPLVPRVLRELFGRRVHRSVHTSASTAIGLALGVDPDAGYTLREQLSRGIGVFREMQSGTSVSFDTLIDAQQRVAADQETVLTRRYRAAHNIGFFRFVEFTRTNSQGVPLGDVMPLGEVLFPFSPALQGDLVNLANVQIVRTENGPLIEERYTIDTHGIVSVEICDCETGFSLKSALG